MNAFFDPAGPLPPSVYWRRRAIVVVLAILVFSGVWTLFSAFNASPTPTPVASPTATTVVACNSSDILLRAETNQESFAAGEFPKFSMTITNAGTTACTLEVGTDKQKYVIMSGSDLIWDSTVCQVSPQPFSQLFEAGQSLTTDAVEWGRARSDNCDNGTPAVGGGASYQLTVYVGEIQSSDAKQFMLY
jgi:hypothetical protein